MAGGVSFLLLGGSLVLGLGFVQPVSQFDIETDGIFTTPEEWSDVAPLERPGPTFVYTALDEPTGDELYLMYDIVGATEPLLPGEIVGPVHFHNSGSDLEVFFLGGSDILVLKDGLPHDTSDPGGGECRYRPLLPPPLQTLVCF